MACLYKKNPGGGFESQHGKDCGRCRQAPPTKHASVSGWCGNVCANCAETISKTHRAEVVEITK